MNFAVINLGCKVNRVESDDVAALLYARGVETHEEHADLIVVNTCTVTGEAEKKTRKAVRRALRANNQAIVLVTGCAAAMNAAFYESLDARVKTVDKAQLLNRVEELSRQLTGVAYTEVPAPDTLLPVGAGFRTRVGVKVQDGCNNACTYCIVHVARGCAISLSADTVSAKCNALVRAGVQEIVLTGINLGSYCDVSQGDSHSVHLVGLLERLLNSTANLRAPNEPAARFRISSVEPCDVDDGLIDLLASAHGRICRHLHLPLQSGSSKVLREMARPYQPDDFIRLVDRLRERVPGISLSTDIIVGFPGESDEEFRETLAVARRCAFSKIHVFPYSRRSGTPAAARADQVPPGVKTTRASQLRALGDELRTQDFARRAGSSELALIEEDGVAMTESYYEIPMPANALVGSLVTVVL